MMITVRLPLVLVAFLVFAPAAVFAQDTAAPPAQGPLVLERVESGFVIAPDYKVTELDGDVAHLAGGYAGWLTGDTLLIGGAAYSVANRSDDFKLTYGGLLVGWTMPTHHRVQFGARGLVGIGRATLGMDVELRDVVARFGSRSLPTQVFRVGVTDDVFVFEPQVTLVTRLTNRIAVNLGAGYRLTALGDRLGDRVNGVSGNVAVQFGAW